MGKSESGNNRTQHSVCIMCGIPMVSGRVRVADRPEGYATHKAHGRCNSCDGKVRHKHEKETQRNTAAKPAQNIEHDKANLESFLKRIRGKSGKV